MRYQIRVAGKVFEGTDYRSLVKRAVEAKRQEVRESRCGIPCSRLITQPTGAQAGA